MRRIVGAGLIAALVGLSAVACEDELGECDSLAAQELVYGQSGLAATKGQALTHDSCGNGAFCHATSAKGEARYGAPAGLNFDMLPVPSGWPVVAEWREAIWTSVTEGGMPPGSAGKRALGDGDWVFDAERREGAARLPALASDEGKAVLRNWLACGAPVVTDTEPPDWAKPPSEPGDGGVVDFGEIYRGILQPKCAIATCHGEAASGGLSMPDECAAYAQLLRSGNCGQVRLELGDGDSLMLDKIESAQPACGGRMPPLPLSGGEQQRIRAWVEGGAPAQNCD